MLSLCRNKQVKCVYNLTRSPGVARVGPIVLVFTDLEGHPRSMIFYVIWKGLCYFLLVIFSNLGPISHRLAIIHPWRTDDDNHDKGPTLSLQLSGRPNKSCADIVGRYWFNQMLPTFTGHDACQQSFEDVTTNHGLDDRLAKQNMHA